MRTITKHNLLLVSITIIVSAIISGCASNTSIKLKELTTNHSKILLIIKPYSEAEEVNKAFGSDLIAKGILPVRVVVSNKSDIDIGIDSENIILKDKNGNIISPMKKEQIYNEVKTSYWTTLLALPLLHYGLIGAAGGITDSNMRVNSRLQSDFFKNGVVNKNDVVDGIIFYNVGNISNIKDWYFSAKIYKRNDYSEITIDIPVN